MNLYNRINKHIGIQLLKILINQYINHMNIIGQFQQQNNYKTYFMVNFIILMLNFTNNNSIKIEILRLLNWLLNNMKKYNKQNLKL